MKHYSKVWLTSFGDLLTLLLCFCVVAIYQAAAASNQKIQSKQIDSNNKQAQIENLKASGKQIASKEVTEFPHLTLSLAKEDFRPSFVGLNRAGSYKLKSFLKQNLGSLEVGVCNVGFDFSEAAFETLNKKLSSRNLSFLIGAAACKPLSKSKNQKTGDVIFVSAKEI